MIQRSPCVYAIRNRLTGRVYVGSTVNSRKRWNEHKSALRHCRHENSYLQRAWMKHGAEAFEFSVLEYVVDETLLESREQAHLDTARPCVYNVGTSTVAPWRGQKFSEAHKAELVNSWARRRKPKAIKTQRTTCSNGHQKLKPGECAECRENRRVARNAQYFVENGPDPRRGKPMSEGRRAQLLARHALKPWSRAGSSHSEKTRAKMRRAWIVRKINVALNAFANAPSEAA